MLTVLDLFSGIGGFSLGLENTNGFKTIAFCENNKFCQKVLAKHWPTIPIFDDISTLNSEDINNLDTTINVICGGFPCQPISISGNQKGECDERWMWPEFYRIICMVKPEWILVENVVGLLSVQKGKLFGGILRDLAQIGYNAEWQVLSASYVGACHQRERLFLVAHTNSKRLYKNIFQFKSDQKSCFEERWPEQSNIYLEDFKRSYPKLPKDLRTLNGISEELDKNRLNDQIRALGNSIVPKCSEYIGKCILNAI